MLVCGAKKISKNFETGKPFMNKLVELSRKLKMCHEKRVLLFIAVTLCYINKIYKL